MSAPSDPPSAARLECGRGNPFRKRERALQERDAMVLPKPIPASGFVCVKRIVLIYIIDYLDILMFCLPIY
jgi:hypothetical protein